MEANITFERAFQGTSKNGSDDRRGHLLYAVAAGVVIFIQASVMAKIVLYKRTLALRKVDITIKPVQGMTLNGNIPGPVIGCKEVYKSSDIRGLRGIFPLLTKLLNPVPGSIPFIYAC